jgi:DNA-binding transcriptional LysR family regulator
MNIADLEAFVAVADKRSIVAAAGKLYLSQSAITRRLQNLEGQLGVTLFHRESRPLALTTEGAEAYRHARTLLANAADMEAALTPGKSVSGDFHLGVSLALGDIGLGRPLDVLRQEYPKLRVRATTDESTVLLRRLEKRELDVAVIVLPEGHPLPDNIAGETLGTDSIVVVAPKSLRFKRGGKITDLADQPWILNPAGCTARDALEKAFAKAGRTPEVVLESCSPGLKLALIQSGRGVGLFFPHVVRHSRFRRTTRMLRPSDFGPLNSIWLVHQPNCGRLTGPIACIREAVKQKPVESDSDFTSPI